MRHQPTSGFLNTEPAGNQGLRPTMDVSLVTQDGAMSTYMWAEMLGLAHSQLLQYITSFRSLSPDRLSSPPKCSGDISFRHVTAYD
jgi:hypothetical protein